MSTDVRRVIAFGALAAFASHHWFLLVTDAEAWRWLVCVAIGVAGASALIALRGRRRPVALAGAAVVFAAMLTGGLLALGIPLASLVPGGGDDLGAELSVGLAGVSQIDTPYGGPDPWTRFGILAAVPLGVSLAMLAAFWPIGEGRLGRALGLALLILLYATSVTWESPGAELARGAALFAFIAAVLWLPHLRPLGVAAPAATVLLAVAIALPLASRVDASDPIVSYADWRVFGAEERIAFNWNHTYGSLDWPQQGSEVFVARTDEPLYWKTYVLDEFNGNAWSRGPDDFGEFPPEYALAGASIEDVQTHPAWVRDFEIDLSGLRSKLAVTAGSPRAVDGLDVEGFSGDGTVTAEDFEIPAGTSYEVSAYVPDPSSRQLRRADGAHQPLTERYTSLLIPQALTPLEKQTGQTPFIRSVAVPPRGVEELPNERRRFEEIGEPLAVAVEGTPYERVLRLTRALTDGARSDFEAVTRIQTFLLSNYDYDQTVPLSKDPIPEFLFEERAGYCQHFSGAMALMLRMAGIPARVASGFAPGARQANGTYSVEDTDAHSWVEVLYPGIGWVTADPTPGAAPARTELAGSRPAPNVVELDGVLGRPFRRDELGQGKRGPLDEPAAAEEGDGSPVPLIAVLLIAGGSTGLIVHRRRRLRSPEGAELQLRELSDALRATGRAPSPGATLLSIQNHLGRAVGPDAARYAAKLRDNRYGPRRRARPGPAERSSFRWELARRSGPLGWWRALRAIPPGGPRA